MVAHAPVRFVCNVSAPYIEFNDWFLGTGVLRETWSPSSASNGSRVAPPVEGAGEELLDRSGWRRVIEGEIERPIDPGDTRKPGGLWFLEGVSAGC